MATTKNRINAYVDDVAFKAFEDWCASNACSASKGVELLIKNCLISGNVTSNVTDDVSYVKQDDLRTVRDEFEAAIAALRGEINQVKELEPVS
jgi:hypothetical protein